MPTSRRPWPGLSRTAQPGNASRTSRPWPSTAGSLVGALYLRARRGRRLPQVHAGPGAPCAGARRKISLRRRLSPGSGAGPPYRRGLDHAGAGRGATISSSALGSFTPALLRRGRRRCADLSGEGRSDHGARARRGTTAPTHADHRRWADVRPCAARRPVRVGRSGRDRPLRRDAEPGARAGDHRQCDQHFPASPRCYRPRPRRCGRACGRCRRRGVGYMGRTRISNLFVNAGHGHLGWTMACGAGRLVADIVAGEPTPIDMTGFPRLAAG